MKSQQQQKQQDRGPCPICDKPSVRMQIERLPPPLGGIRSIAIHDDGSGFCQWGEFPYRLKAIPKEERKRRTLLIDNCPKCGQKGNVQGTSGWVKGKHPEHERKIRIRYRVYHPPIDGSKKRVCEMNGPEHRDALLKKIGRWLGTMPPELEPKKKRGRPRKLPQITPTPIPRETANLKETDREYIRACIHQGQDSLQRALERLDGV